MDHDGFDALTRGMAGVPRRAVIGSLAAGLAGLAGQHLAADAEAGKRRKKKRKGRCQPNCAERACGSDGCGGSCGTCAADQVCARGECCVPEPKGATCAGRCGTRRNNCGQAVECATCPDGQVCIGNGSCAIACTSNNDCDPCGGGACSNPDIEGNRHCIDGLVNPITTCKTTADCPPQSHCQDLGGGGVCIELCV